MMEHRRNNRHGTVKTFNSAGALREYTIGTGKIFPKLIGKDKLVKILLRHILQAVEILCITTSVCILWGGGFVGL